MMWEIKNVFEPHRWFAWHPVIIDNNYEAPKWVWLAWIFRECEYLPEGDFQWIYFTKDPREES